MKFPLVRITFPINGNSFSHQWEFQFKPISLTNNTGGNIILSKVILHEEIDSLGPVHKQVLSTKHL
jgi:hypothetical protein